MHLMRNVILVIALLGTAQGLRAQAPSVPVRVLSRAEVELPQQFSRISGVRELADGRVIVVDAEEKLVALVDFARLTRTRIGREGRGPGEYVSPNTVLAASGDSTIVRDLSGRLSKLTPSGVYAGSVTIPGAESRDATVRATDGFGRIASDARGRIYRQASEFGTRHGGGTDVRDSIAIQRIDLQSGKIDTAAWLPVPPMIVETTRDGGGISPGGRREGPYVARTTWVVAPDGRIAVISPEPYQVTWFAANAQRIVGRPIAFQKVPVTIAEKQAYRDNYASMPNKSVSIAMSPSGGVTNISSSPEPFREPEYWPAHKDPFGNAPLTVLTSPAGDVWVLKQLAHTATNPTYDVIDGRGELAGRVVVPERSRVVGIGRNGAAYVVRLDDDDLQYLQRFRIR
jgi:hypothetical protein